MKDSSLLIEGISQYITGSAFLSEVSSFIDENCCMFDGSAEYSPGQFAIWKEFTNKVNEMLSTVLKDLGCSDVKDFIIALEDPEVASSPRTVAVIDSLKSMDDFIQFHDNMVARNAELERLEHAAVEEEKTSPNDECNPPPSSLRKPFTANNFTPNPKPSPDDRQTISTKRFKNNSVNSAIDTSNIQTTSLEIQLAMAQNLIVCKQNDSLTQFQSLQIPWAEGIIETADDINDPNLDSRRRLRLTNKLNRHKLKVDFICTRKDINDRREDIVNDLARLSSEKKIVRLFSILEELRNDIGDERGYAIGYMDHLIPADSLQKIYLNFKSFLKEGNDPVERVADVYELSVGQGELEPDDSGFLVIMLKWLELETLVDEINKKITSLLNNAEREQQKQPGEESDYENRLRKAMHESKQDDEPEEIAQEGEDEIVWLEQYDEKSGYNFFFNTKTGESTWEAPNCAYVPFSLDQMGYELVEESGGTNSDDTKDWIWNDKEGRWDYMGAETDDPQHVMQEDANLDPNIGPGTNNDDLPKSVVTHHTAEYKEDDEPVVLKLDINSAPSSPVRSNDSKKKKKKKKKKFIVRPKADSPQVLPFYMAATTTKSQQKQMEDMLLGISSDPDNTEPKTTSGRKSVEKKKSSKKQQPQSEDPPSSTNTQLTNNSESKRPSLADINMTFLSDGEDFEESCSTPPPPISSPLPPNGLPPLASKPSFHRKNSLPPLLPPSSKN